MTEETNIPAARLRYIGSVPQSLVANRVVQLNKEVVSFGRDKNKVDVFLDSSRVPRMISRVHAIMRVQDEKWLLNDNRSVNGAYVNGQLVKGNVVLSHGDTVVFGRHYPESEFVYRFEEGEEADQPSIIQSEQPESLIISSNPAPATPTSGFASSTAAPPSITSSVSQTSAPTAAAAAPVPPTITPTTPDGGDDSKPASGTGAKGGALGTDLEEEFTCSICQSLLARAATLPCSHSFCSECITHWLGRKRTCPSCRETATLKNLVPSRVLDNAIDRIKHLVLDEDDLHDHKERVERWDNRPPQAATPPPDGGRGRGGPPMNILRSRAYQVMAANNFGGAGGNLPPPPPRVPPPPPAGAAPSPRGPGTMGGMPQMMQGMNLGPGRGMPQVPPRPSMPPGRGGPPSMPPGRGGPPTMMPPGRGGPPPPRMPPGSRGPPPGMMRGQPPMGMPMDGQQFGGGMMQPGMQMPPNFQQMMPPPGIPFSLPQEPGRPGQVPGTEMPMNGGGQLISSHVLFARGPAFQQRQACRLCGVQVTQGTLCIQGIFSPNVESYYHVPCFCLDESVPKVERPGDFPGYSELDATERAAFETLLVQGIRERMERER